MSDWQSRITLAVEHLRGKADAQAAITAALLRGLEPEQLASVLAELEAEEEAALTNLLGSQAGDAAIDAFRQDLAALRSLAPGRRRRA